MRSLYLFLTEARISVRVGGVELCKETQSLLNTTMQAPIKLLIPFEALVNAIAVLDRDDQLRLRRILDQYLNQTEDLDAFWAERGCSPPLKEGLTLTTNPAHSGQANIAIDHDQIVTQQFEADP